MTLHHRTADHHHGTIDPAITASQQGLWAVQWSFAGLMVTALLQLAVVFLSGSIALLADTIHNFADASTAIPLGIAFLLARWKPTKRFTYGYGRVEDLAGVMVVLTILISAIVAGYESIHRLLHPESISHLWAVAVAALIGFGGNELVAMFRIKTGKAIGSAALVADGHHARVDGLTSLSVLLGALCTAAGYPIADPLIGLFITGVILVVVWQSAKTVFTRLLDGVEPGVLDEIRHAAQHVSGVHEVTEIRVRWIGHRLHAEVNIAVASNLSVKEGHTLAKHVQHEILHHLQYLSIAIIHVDPLEEAGEAFHQEGGRVPG